MGMYGQVIQLIANGFTNLKLINQRDGLKKTINCPSDSGEIKLVDNDFLEISADESENISFQLKIVNLKDLLGLEA